MCPDYLSALQLVMNIYPIDVPDTNIRAGHQPYRDPEHLDRLRRDTVSTHIIKRRGDSLVDVPYVKGAEILGTPGSIPLATDLGICRTLILTGLLNHFLQKKLTVLNLDPLDFFYGKDILSPLIPPDLSCPEWIRVRTRCGIHVRTLYPDARKPLIALAIQVRTASIIDAPLTDLLEKGINPIGRYVQMKVPNKDQRLQPRRILAGRVSGIQQDQLTLDDARQGLPPAMASDSFLEPRRENLHECLRIILGQRADSVIRQLDSQVSTLNNGPGKLDQIRKFAGYLKKQNIDVLPGIKLQIGPALDKNSIPKFPATAIEDKPTLVFGGSKTDTWHDRGLDKFGPYDRATFTPSSPRIAVLCQSRHRGQTEQFLNKLLNGLPSVIDGKGRAPFRLGMIRKYCLDKCQFEFFESHGDSVESYRSAIARSIETSTEQKVTWNLALVQIEERFHLLPGDSNPYLSTKALLLQHGIPSQEIELETMQVKDAQLVYVLNNIALASYAKLGGIPWLLQANRGVSHELVFGLGSAWIGEGRLGSKERLVAITTVFSGDGNYLLENRSKAATIEDYPIVLLESLQQTIGNVRRMMNWQERDSVRLIFHAFKPLRKEQIEAVRTLVGELGQFEVQYAFLHVVQSHPYTVFDLANTEGFWDSQAKSKKGQLAPPRGITLRMSDSEILLSLTGGREVKRPQDGIPQPILLRLDSNSTFKDAKYLARQVYHFASHSWRSFFPAPMPITILYSELIAQLLGHFNRLPRWDPQTMLGPIGRTRWFL